MDKNHLKAIVEGILFASGDHGITIKQMSRILNIPHKDVANILEALKSDYESPNRGIRVLQSKDTYFLTTKQEHSAYLKKLLDAPRSTKLSQAALETLAIIAYKQPITRVEIEDIRGVKSDRPIQTLVARSLIEEVGRKEDVGRPILFGTTTHFLTYFGLTSLEELPPLPEDFHSEDIKQDIDLYFEHHETLNHDQ